MSDKVPAEYVIISSKVTLVVSKELWSALYFANLLSNINGLYAELDERHVLGAARK